MTHETHPPKPSAPTSPALAAAIRRHRPGGWTLERMTAFLRMLEEAGEVRAACGAIGLSTRSAYKLRRRNPAFADAWEAALARRAAQERRELGALRDLAEDGPVGKSVARLSDAELCRALSHIDDVLARAARSRQPGGNFRIRGRLGASTRREL